MSGNTDYIVDFGDGNAVPTSAQDAAMTLDEKVNSAFAAFTGPFVSFIFAPIPGTSFPWIVMWLVIGATIFTFYFAFVQFRYFGHAISLVKGDYSDPDDAGEVSHFQALATALSGTVGLGNIAGLTDGCWPVGREVFVEGSHHCQRGQKILVVS